LNNCITSTAVSAVVGRAVATMTRSTSGLPSMIPAGAGIGQHVDFRIGPGPPQAADQRRRQQRVADAPQRDHQNA
jgi:hypothetical protein